MKTLRLFVCIFAVGLLHAQTIGNAPNAQGNANQGASGASDKNSQRNNPGSNESQPAAVASSVNCAIKLPYKDDQSAPTAKWLDLAKNCQNSPEDNSDKNPTAGLKNKLFLSMSLTKGKLVAADKTPAKFEDLRLVINGVEIGDAKLSWEASDDRTAVLSTQLARTESSKAAWNELLAQKLRKHWVRVTVTDASKKPLESHAYFNLQMMQFRWYTWVLLAILLILVIVLLTDNRLKEMNVGRHRFVPCDPLVHESVEQRMANTTLGYKPGKLPEQRRIIPSPGASDHDIDS